MAISPSSDNYTLGRGKLFFTPTGGLEVSLGNAPSLTFNLAVEKLEHFSSTSGLKAKDKSVVTQVTPSLKFTLDECNRQNLNMLFYGAESSRTQTAGQNLNKALTTTAVKGAYYDTGYRNIGIYRMTISGASQPFTYTLNSEDTLTGGTSSDTAKVVYHDTVNNYLYLTTLAGSDPYFSVGETVTGTGGATATVVSVPTFQAGTVIAFNATKSTIYTASDIIVNSRAGIIGIAESGSIAASSAVSCAFCWKSETYYALAGLSVTSLEGKIRFVSENPVGPQMEARFWKVDLAPDGDTAFIGTDWSQISFTGEILKDETNHPTSPYMDILMS